MRGWPKTLEAARDAFLSLLRRQDGVPSDRRAVTGGYIGPPGSVPLLLSRGHAFVTTAQIEAFGGLEKLRAAFPSTDFELLITAEEAREFGQRTLRALQEQIEAGIVSTSKLADELLGEGGVIGGEPDQHGDDLGLVDPPVQPPSTPES